MLFMGKESTPVAHWTSPHDLSHQSVKAKLLLQQVRSVNVAYQIKLKGLLKVHQQTFDYLAAEHPVAARASLPISKRPEKWSKNLPVLSCKGYDYGDGHTYPPVHIIACTLSVHKHRVCICLDAFYAQSYNEAPKNFFEVKINNSQDFLAIITQFDFLMQFTHPFLAPLWEKRILPLNCHTGFRKSSNKNHALKNNAWQCKILPKCCWAFTSVSGVNLHFRLVIVAWKSLEAQRGWDNKHFPHIVCACMEKFFSWKSPRSTEIPLGSCQYTSPQAQQTD